MLKTILIQIIQFIISIQCRCQKQFYFKQFSLPQVHNLVLFDPLIGTWCGPKVGTTKENTEHGLEVRKVYHQKLQRVSGSYNPVVSNIGSRTTSTPVLLRY